MADWENMLLPLDDLENEAKATKDARSDFRDLGLFFKPR